MKLYAAPMLMIFLLFSNGYAQDQEEDINHPVQVGFVLPAEFRDFRSESFNSRKDRERLMKVMRNHFRESAQRFLPQDHKLQVRITNVDLAGHLFPVGGSFGDEQRIVKPAYPPRMEFTYQWLDPEDKLILSGEAKLVGHNLVALSHRASRHRNRSLGLERGLIDKWMRELKTYWKENHLADQ